MEKIGNINLSKVFGHVNNNKIKKVILEVQENNKNTQLEYLVDDEMFIFYWDENLHNYKLINLLGIDEKNRVIYKENFKNRGNNDKTSTYVNEDYHITLQYPSNWEANNDYFPPRYEGKDGYFLIGAIGGEDMSVDEVVDLEANHKLKPYGSSPKVSPIIINFIEGRLIVPSEDQPDEMENQAGIIVKYPNPINLNGKIYMYFVLWADKEHIEEISKTIEFSH